MARGYATSMLCGYDDSRRGVVFSSNLGQTLV